MNQWCGWCLISVGLVICVYWVANVYSQLSNLSHNDSSIGIDEHLTNVVPSEAPWLLQQEGGSWGKYGWSLDKGEKGSLAIALPGNRNGRVRLRLWAYNAGDLKIKLGDVMSSENLNDFNAETTDMPVHGCSRLLVSASNSVLERQLVLDRFAAAWFPPGSDLPSLLPLGGGVVVLLLGWLLLLHRTSMRVVWCGCSIIVVLSLSGLLLRWRAFDMVRALPLRPDTIGYVAYAHSMDWFTMNHGFYSGSFSQREPLFIAMLNLWSRLWGEGWPASAKLLTVVLSTTLTAASGFFAWRLSGRWYLGALMALVITVSPAVINESVQGLRTESEMLLFLAVLAAWLWGKGRLGSVLLGAAIGLASLMLTGEGLYVFVPLIWLGWLLNSWRLRRHQVPLTPSQWKGKQLLAASIVAVALYAPHVYGVYRSFGDVSRPTKLVARWLANSEFQERLGTPGFPTQEEFTKSSYAGPPITISSYFFGLHSIPTLIKGQIKGWVLSTAYMSASFTPNIVPYVFLYHASGFRAVLRHLRWLSAVIFVLALSFTAVGWVDLWRRREYWWVPFLTLWGTWFTAYIYSARLVEPFRHTAYVYPLLVFCMLWGGLKTLECISRRVGKKI